MGGTPLRATAVEEALAGGASPADAAAHAAEGTEPSSDTAASAEFRMHLARVLTKRALAEALGLTRAFRARRCVAPRPDARSAVESGLERVVGRRARRGR